MPSTQRLIEAARSSPACGGERERPCAGNNPAQVNDDQKIPNTAAASGKKLLRELLFFGKDFLVLNLGPAKNDKMTSLHFLDGIFSFSHNDTNAAEILNIEWGNSGIDVAIHYAFTKEGDELALIFQGKEKIISIQKVRKDSELRKRLGYKYLYRISFYGVFFALARIGKLNIEAYWKLFLDDITTGLIENSLSRLDLCADLTNIRPIDIAKGVHGDETHMKEFSTMRGRIKKPNPQTMMYGAKGDNNFFGRIYNKLIEMAKKGKERFYLDYLLYELVTRLELVFKSPVLRDQYHLTLADCLDTQLLFNIFCDYLHTKFVTWDILPFIKREMKTKGFKRMTLERYKKHHNPMPRDKKFRRIINAVKRYKDAYDYDLKLLCDRIYLSIEEDDD